MGEGLARVWGAPRSWRLLLALVWAVLGISLTLVYWPGRANNDIAYQAAQAQGRIPFTDWHPPIMSALWQLLIGLTGQVGSLLAVQVGLFCLAGWLLSALVFRRTRSRGASLLPLAGLLAPWSLSQLGMLWKDTQMATAFLAAAGLLFLIRPRAPRSLWLLAPATVLLVYGTGVRKNAAAAVVALACAAAWVIVRAVARSRRGRRTRQTRLVIGAVAAGVLAVLLAATAGTGAAVGAAHHVQRTGQSSQIMLDDVLFSVPAGELAGTGLPPEFVEHAERARAACLAMGEPWDAYWNCWGRGESGAMYSPLAESDRLAIAQAWRGHVIAHPLRYAAYRAHVWGYYLFTSRLEYWPSDQTRDADAAGLRAEFPGAERGIEAYVVASARGLGWTFKPWFWAAAGLIALATALRMRRFRLEVTVLAGSALCYIGAYFFIAPANHFRYTYWAALAVTSAWMLIAAHVATRHVRRASAATVRGLWRGNGSGTVSESSAPDESRGPRA